MAKGLSPHPSQYRLIDSELDTAEFKYAFRQFVPIKCSASTIEHTVAQTTFDASYLIHRVKSALRGFWIDSIRIEKTLQVESESVVLPAAEVQTIGDCEGSWRI